MRLASAFALCLALAAQVSPASVPEPAAKPLVIASHAGSNVPDGLADWWRLHRTLDQFESPLDWRGAYARALDELRAMKQAGVGFLAGTDFGARLVYPGFSLHDELALLVEEVGLSPLAALQSATLNPPRFFGLQGSLGTIEKGKIADLVLLDANPLEDIRNTEKIRAVVLNGRHFDRAALDRLLAQAESAARQ